MSQIFKPAFLLLSNQDAKLITEYIHDEHRAGVESRCLPNERHLILVDANKYPYLVPKARGMAIGKGMRDANWIAEDRTEYPLLYSTIAGLSLRMPEYESDYYVRKLFDSPHFSANGTTGNDRRFFANDLYRWLNDAAEQMGRGLTTKFVNGQLVVLSASANITQGANIARKTEHVEATDSFTAFVTDSEVPQEVMSINSMDRIGAPVMKIYTR